MAAIKRLLPIGLNVFGGPEQELVQMAKDKMIEVSDLELDLVLSLSRLCALFISLSFHVSMIWLFT